MDLFLQIANTLENGDDQTVSRLTNVALENGAEAGEILDQALLAGMNVISEKFKAREIFLPDVLLAARAMNAGMELLKPFLTQSEQAGIGKIVIGTVKGDLHDIGKNLVGIMLKGAGFEVIDLGKDVAPRLFVETAVKEQADVIGLSALLTTTMPVMKDVIALLREKNQTDRIKVIVGGAPASEDFAKEIGAQAYAFDAASAVDRIKQLI
ncbi:MAG: corrinoid protein [Candidatus Marinimicrobia bacterium]|nr:corrinoid protein [Candidatus Neomarinimicrobiota bacterium]